MVHGIVVDAGCEKVLAQALEKKYDVKIGKISSSFIQFDSDFLVACEVAYTFQGAIKVLVDVEELVIQDTLPFSFNKEKIISDIRKYSEGKVKISCVRSGVHAFTSVDAAKFVADSLDVPKDSDASLQIFLYIKDDAGYIGIDIAGRVLSKRDYKIFMGAASLRGTLAYAITKFIDVKKTSVILDPFMGSGMILIEAALERVGLSPFYFSKENFAFRKFEKISIGWSEWFANLDSRRKSPDSKIYGFDGQLKFLKYAQKNAKIADVHKDIILSKVNIDWLDTKLDKHSIDVIITDPPLLAERSNKSSVLKTYKDFFNEAAYVLSKKGRILVIANAKSLDDLCLAAESNGFKETERHIVYEGQQDRMVIIFDYA